MLQIKHQKHKYWIDRNSTLLWEWNRLLGLLLLWRLHRVRFTARMSLLFMILAWNILSQREMLLLFPPIFKGNMCGQNKTLQFLFFPLRLIGQYVLVNRKILLYLRKR